MTTSEQPTSASAETPADSPTLNPLNEEDGPPTPTVLTAESVGKVVRTLGGLDVRQLDGTVSASEEGLFGIIYGQAGSGKTTLAASANESLFGAPYLHIDAEGGKDAILDRKDVQVVSVYNWNQFQAITRDLIKEKGAGYKTVCVDNLSEVANMSLTKISGATGAPEIQEWGEMFREVRQKIREYRDIARLYGVNVIFCCWDADEKDDRGVLKKDLALSPALRKQVPGLTTIIGYIQVLDDPNARMLTFAANPKSVAKFRRSRTAAANKIPLSIKYSADKLPLGDIITVLKGGGEWDVKKYPPLATPAGR